MPALDKPSALMHTPRLQDTKYACSLAWSVLIHVSKALLSMLYSVFDVLLFKVQTQVKSTGHGSHLRRDGKHEYFIKLILAEE